MKIGLDLLMLDKIRFGLYYPLLGILPPKPNPIYTTKPTKPSFVLIQSSIVNDYKQRINFLVMV